jgi:hypothetical protein
MTVNIGALASQSAAQGQQMLNDDNANAATYKGQYGDYQNQANAAQKGVSDYTAAMQGAYDPNKGTGNAGSVYNYGLNDQLGRTGYNQGAMTTASNNLNQANGALSAYSDFANQAASKWGLNAGGFAAANAGALGGLNNNIASNQGQVAQLMDKYKTAQTGANQFTGQVVQGEQNTLGGLQQVYTNAANQRDTAAQQMNFYSDLAQKQGGMNAQQQQAYAAAQQAYAAAQQSMAQAGLLSQQTNLARQQYEHQASLYNVNPAAQANSDAMYAAMNHASPATAAASPAQGWNWNRVVNDVNHGAGAAVNGAGHYLGGLLSGASW